MRRSASHTAMQRSHSSPCARRSTGGGWAPPCWRGPASGRRRRVSCRNDAERTAGTTLTKALQYLSSRYTRHTDAFSCNMKRDVCFCFDSSLHIVSIYSAVRAAPSRAGATRARHTTHTVTDVSHDLRDTLGRNTELRYFAYSTNTVLHSGSRLASHCIMSLNAPTGTEPSASPNRSLLLPLLVLRL